MPHPNAARGKRWELSTRRFLEETFGRRVRKPAQEGFLDVGDLHLSPWALQCKDEARHTFSSYVDDAEAQALHAGEGYGGAVVKRRNQGVDRAYFVASLGTFRRVTARLLRAEELLQRHAPEAYAEHARQIQEDR